MDTKVTLIDWPRNVMETLYVIWQAGRTTGPLLDSDEVAQKCVDDDDFAAEVQRQCRVILDSHLPVVESLYFTFIIENMSISLREQMVRHRIGTHMGPDMGVDIVPELPSSTWWSQSMRVMDMGKFADEGRYRIPEGLETKAVKVGNEGLEIPAKDRYIQLMEFIQTVYHELTEAGVKNEDAREILPMAVQHRTSWTLSLASIFHIVGKRSCWILQTDLWAPVIQGMIHELADKVNPYFLELANPPCIKGEVFTGCVHMAETEERLRGRDQLPPCSLYLHKQLLSEDGDKATSAYENIDERGQRGEYERLAKKYGALWRRDPNTGERI